MPTIKARDMSYELTKAYHQGENAYATVRRSGMMITNPYHPEVQAKYHGFWNAGWRAAERKCDRFPEPSVKGGNMPDMADFMSTQGDLLRPLFVSACLTALTPAERKQVFTLFNQAPRQ